MNCHILLSREAFKAAVLLRDGQKCVFCSAPAVDAHHIMERRLWPDGGYYLSNGASVGSYRRSSMLSRLLRSFALLALFSQPSAAQQKFEPFQFPTGDVAGTYTMLSLKKTGANQVETIVHEKMNRSGNESFTRRMIDCRGDMRVKTVASGFTLEDLKKSKPSTEWVSLVPGSSAHGTAVAAYARIK